MINKQPEALRLAEHDERLSGIMRMEPTYAPELRRLHEVNAELVEALRLMNIECHNLHHAKKDQHGYDVDCPVVGRIKASLTKATGEQHAILRD